jgi:glycosyltransferase involved in cell wall biosynthesis
MKKSKALYYAPVDKELFEKWEYYQCDLRILESLFCKVTVCHSLLSLLLNLPRSKLVYCWWWHSSLPAILLGKLSGIPVYCTGAIHMFDYSGAPDFFSKSFFYRFATKIALRLADRNIFISQDQALAVTSHLSVNNAETISSSLLRRDPPAELTTLVGSRTCGEGKLYFLFFSWMTTDQLKRKGFRETLKAFSLFCTMSNADVTLRIGGHAGNNRSYVQSLVSEYGLSEKVEYHFDITSREKEALYMSSHLFLCPSYLEGFGNACLEAMSFGMVALVSRYGASHEVLGDVGFVVPIVCPKEICEVMLKYERLSPQDKKTLEEKALDRAYNMFSFDKRLGAISLLTDRDCIV